MFMKFILATVFVLAAGLFHPTLACSCMDSGPPCEAWGKADGVFMGRVVHVSRFDVRVNSQLNVTETYLRVRFQVESAFRGVAVGTVEIMTSADSGGGCGYPFELNRRYVVYAHRGPNNLLSTSICSRTRRVENAAEDVSFFRSLVTAPPLARVFGQLGFRENVPLLAKPRLGPLAGARVVVEGTGRLWETQSDEQGRYEIPGLPAGTYEVKPQLGPGSLAQFYPPSTEVKLVERGCAQANAYAQIDGRISGRLTDGDGVAVPDQTVDIMPEGMSPLEGRTWELPTAITKKDGTYELAALPSGRYVVGVNLRSPPRPLLPGRVVYPRTYFPSAGERSEAQVIELTAGMEQRGVNIVLPKPLERRKIRGTVLWSGGKRVKRANVMLSNPEYGAAYNTFVQSDDNGAFAIDAYEGLPYVITAASNNDPNGKPLQGRINSSPTSADGEPITVTLPYPATLQGRLVDALGKPQANVEVELILEETRDWETAFKSPLSIRVRSDSRGMFKMAGLAPRRYVLAIHASSPPRQYEQYEYPPAYYPGTGNRNFATVIPIGEGQQVELSDFVLPERLVPEIVQGIVVWPDDRPVQSGSVTVEDLDFPGWTHVASGPIAPDGRFELPLFVGRRYVIQAVTNKDQEGRDLLWLLEAKSAEILVDAKSRGLKVLMPILP
jgi:hypothetical protein